MTTRMVVLALLLLSMPARAQLNVQVLDDVAKRPVTDAHITCQPLNDTPGTVMVSGPDGRASADLDPNTWSTGVILRISHIGYGTRVDTLFSPGPHLFLLTRSELELPEVVVTGQYAPNSPDKAVHKVRILDASYFQRIAANNLAEGLRNELNIRIRQDNILGSSMSMQGLGGENVKVLIDGVPVIGRLNGSIDLSQLDLTGIERAEIIEGPLSVSYGTNALAGTINLITAKPSEAPATLKATAYVEHIGRLNISVSGANNWGGNEVSMALGRNYFDGWSPDGPTSFGPAPADTNRFQEWKPREQHFGRVGYRRSIGNWDLGYKGEFMNDLIINKGRPRPPYNETAFDEEYVTRRMDNALFAEGRLAKDRRFSAQFAHNGYRRTRNTWFRDLTSMSEQLVDIEGMQDTAWTTLTNLRSVYSSSELGSMVHYELGIDLNLETGAGERIGEVEQAIGDHAVFGSMEVRTTERLTWRPGLRYAYNTRYQAPVVPSLNVRWQFSEATTLRAAYAMGFRAPSLKELHFYFVDVNHDIVGNPDLDAESSDHLSVGLTDRRSRGVGELRSELNMFYNDVQDMITLAQISGTRYSYINVGNMRTYGGTIGTAWTTERWTCTLGTGITGRKDAIGEASDGNWYYTPEINASLSRAWRASGWNASLSGKYQGEQVTYVLLSDTQVEHGSIDPYCIADLSVSKSLWSERARMTFGCKDLLDVRNVNATTASGAHGSSGTSVPMTTGRTFFVRFDLSLTKKER